MIQVVTFLTLESSNRFKYHKLGVNNYRLNYFLVVKHSGERHGKEKEDNFKNKEKSSKENRKEKEEVIILQFQPNQMPFRFRGSTIGNDVDKCFRKIRLRTLPKLTLALILLVKISF